MYQIVKDLFMLPWSNTVAFKGGTLAYFLHGLTRFSTDIDLDFREGLPTNEQAQQIEKILSSHGTIKDIQRFRNLYRYILTYGEKDYNIKIECNARIREANTYETVSFFGSPIQVMDKATMFANKLVAVMDRPTPTSRDLRDIHFFFTNHFPINTAVITERTGLEPKDFFVALHAYIKEHFTAKSVVDANLGVVLDPKQKARAKEYLIQEVLGFLELQRFES